VFEDFTVTLGLFVVVVQLVAELKLSLRPVLLVAVQLVVVNAHLRKLSTD
jgi:hypothetical protein